MSLSALLNKIQPILENNVTLLPPPWPRCQLFFSVSNGEERAIVINVSGKSFQDAWKKGTQTLQKRIKRRKEKVKWLKVDWTKTVEEHDWKSFKSKELEQTKRNYYRYGMALDPKLEYSFLEQELNSNAAFYQGNQFPMAGLNEKNFIRYAHLRFHKKIPLDFSEDKNVYRLEHQGVFCSNDDEPQLLYGIGRDAGRRIIEDLDEKTTRHIVTTSSDYLASQVLKSGRFNYGWHPCFDRAINTYNTLRHASSTYAMLEGWEVTRNSSLLAAIKRSLRYLDEELIKKYTLEDGSQAAFLTDLNDEIKLGGNAVCLLALTKYTELTEDNQYLSLLEQLALGIHYMQNPQNGSFVHVLNSQDLSLKEAFRTIYYEGEAAFGLMRLYGLTKDERWLKIVTDAFEYFIEKDHWKTHDHWLSYCVNELTLYRPEARYYEFGIKNFSGHLDFVLERITTFPTLLELMMAAHKMIGRLQKQTEFSYLIDKIDLEKFEKALKYRAQYLMNGYFWPESAMYFHKPDKIVGSCYIRHHSFRVRIDDVEHYLSGYVAYLHYYLGIDPPIKASNKLSDDRLSLISSSKTITKTGIEKIKPLSDLLANEPQHSSPYIQDKNIFKGGINWNPERIAEATQGRWKKAPSSYWRATGLCIHHSTFQAGEFITVQPESSKRYIPVKKIKQLPFFPQALISQEPLTDNQNPTDMPVLEVESIEHAILDIGRYARKQFQGKIIGITGSSGKSTLGAMLEGVLSINSRAVRTRNNSNQFRGIAWNLSSIPWDTDFALLEVAIGGIRKSSELLSPDVAVITAIEPAHLEYHKTTEQIAHKKSMIMLTMAPNATVIIPRDSEHWPILSETAKKKSLRIISFGKHPESDIHLQDYNPSQKRMTIKVMGEMLQLEMAFSSFLYPEHILAGLATMTAIDKSSPHEYQLLQFFKPLAHRGDISRLAALKQSLLIDDCYGANPSSMRKALELFTKYPAVARRVLILGDMHEIGDQTQQQHLNLIPYITDTDAAIIYLLGPMMHLLKPALEKQNIECINIKNIQELPQLLFNNCRANDTILVKGSKNTELQSMISSLKLKQQPELLDDSLKKETYGSDKKVQFDNYRIIETLDKAGYSEVFKAEDTKSKEIYALKCIHHPRYIDLLENEFAALKLINNHNNLKLHHAAYSNDDFYFVFDYASSGNLKKHVEQNGTFSLTELENFICDMCDTLAFMNSNQILHLDIKPANILKYKNKYCLMDWGTAIFGHKSKSLHLKGNPIYIAPEFYSGERTIKSEIYSLGCSLFFLATGKHIFQLRNRYNIEQKIYSHLYLEPDLSEVQSPKIKYLISKMLDKNPSSRIGIDQILKILKNNKFENLKSTDTNSEKINFEAPYDIYMKMASDNIPYAQNWLARYYKDTDLTKSINWLEKAANNGYAIAQNRLAYIYFNETFQHQNYNKAYHWFDRSSQQGHDMALFYIGLMYENGYFVKKDINKAKEYYVLSARKGYKKAYTKLQEYDIKIRAKLEERYL